jgi:hypothetical protein
MDSGHATFKMPQKNANVWHIRITKEMFSVESFLDFSEIKIKAQKSQVVSIYTSLQVTPYQNIHCPLCKKHHAPN